MRSIEVSARTLEEATSLAAQELGVSPEALTIEILEEPRKLLGLRAGGEFRIRATTDQEPGPHIHSPQAQPQEPPTATTPTDTVPEEDHSSVPPLTNAQQAAQAALDLVSHLLQLMHLQASAHVRSADREQIVIEIAGKDAASLIGRHGATLNALQLLVGIITSRRTHTSTRILLDIEGYRQRRERIIQQMAREHAAQAKQARKEVVIPDLLPYERRIIHLTLRDDPDVETYSEGEGDDRHLVISPRL